MNKIIRVFPRFTNLSPRDELARFSPPGLWAECDEVHISVLFTYDMRHADFLEKQWRHVAPTKMGGPAFNQPEGDFQPGFYVRKGAVITSRGCPNRCWFCSVWKRNPKLVELPITNGNNLLDDNLLACSESHIRNVFAMLNSQKERIQITGGLEAARLQQWHVDLLVKLKPAQMFFAYDEPDDEEPLRIAAKILCEAGFTRHQLRCYCLIGYPGDTIYKAQKRLYQCIEMNFYPMAMLWQNEFERTDIEWKRFQKKWARPASIYNMVKNRSKGEPWMG